MNDPASGRCGIKTSRQVGAEVYDFPLQPEFLSLEFPQAKIVGRRSSHFILDRVFQELVAGSKFTNSSL